MPSGARRLVHASATLTDAADNDGLKVLPAYYSLETGKVEIVEG